MAKIKITCISDLHGAIPILEGGDLLICAGDCTAHNTEKQWHEFFEWLERQPYRKICLVAGNHDGMLKNLLVPSWIKKKLDVYSEDSFEYLEDSGTEFEGLKIYGAPWTPVFCNWHFMLPRGEPLKRKWDMIPDDTDILITHGPPYGVLDLVESFEDPRVNEHAGCYELKLAVERVNPRLHVFGHIHIGHGILDLSKEKYPPHTIFVNAAIMNEKYRPENKPITIELEI